MLARRNEEARSKSWAFSQGVQKTSHQLFKRHQRGKNMLGSGANS
jgi:hypothetical protein